MYFREFGKRENQNIIPFLDIMIIELKDGEKTMFINYLQEK